MVGPAEAQHITIDGSLSPAQTLLGPNYTIGANLGKQVGGNLFHSFGVFGLTSGESATFSGPATVSNIIGRVTGGSPSSIDGTVKSTVAGANVYLINPAGIVFGPNATVNVSGSFRAATADYLKLSDGSRFQATNPSGSTLSAAAPAAFGFLNAAPPALTLNGSTLSVNQGQTLGLAGGQISLSGATLQAPGGTVHLTGVASAGEVPVDPQNQAAMTVTALAPVSVTQHSTITVSNGNGVGAAGSVFVKSGALTIDNSKIDALNFGPVAGGPINIAADSLSITDGGVIESLAFGAGNAGPITANVNGALSINNGKIVSNTFSAGNAGAINVTAGSGLLTGGGEIASVTQGPGLAGAVSLTVGGALTIDGTGATQNAPSGVLSQTLASGNAGSVSVTAQDLTLTNGGLISTSTFFGSGNAGQVFVNAGNVSLSNGGVIFSDTFDAGNAGQINVTAGNLSMVSSGRIASTAQVGSQGNAGSVTVNVPGSLTIDGTGSTLSAQSGIFALALFNTAGNAGQISVNAGNLSVVTGGDISTTTFGGGAGGRVAVSAQNLAVASGGSISSLTFTAAPAGNVEVAAGSLAVNGGIISTTALGAGAAGQVSISAGTVALANGVISSSTIDDGNAGSVSLTAGSLTISNAGLIATNTSGAGTGGDIKLVVAGDIELSGPGPVITAGATSSGDAGSIRISAANLSLQNDARISTQATTANGGNITLAVGDFLHLVSSKITTSVLGASGNGGNITIDPQLLVLDHSSIIARAVAGHGGNITINANNFLPSADSVVSASSQLGISGTVELIGPRVDLNGSLVVLPSDLHPAADIVRTGCETTGRPQSHLVDVGHGGLPQSTDTTIPALYLVDRDVGNEVAPSPVSTILPDSGVGSRALWQTTHLTMGCR